MGHEAKTIDQLGDAVIHTNEGVPRYGSFEVLDKLGVRNAFSLDPQNMSFGGEQESTGREQVNTRLSEMLTVLGLPLDKQISMTANLRYPSGNFLVLDGSKPHDSNTISNVKIEELPEINDIYGDQSEAPYPRLVEGKYRADGMFTTEAGVVLELVTRDCVPVILCVRNGENDITGLIHGGRKQVEGFLAKRMLNTAVELSGASLEDIHLAIAPAIGPCHYIFDRNMIREDEGPSPFVDESRWEGFREEIDQRHFRIDVMGRFTADLLEAGIPDRNISTTGGCTYELDEAGSSRASLRYQQEHKDQPQGRMITIVGH